MTVHVVIPVHNNVEMTLACLDALAWQDGVASSVVVVDDGSTDGTAEVVGRTHPEATVLRGTGKLWWTGAVRMGVEYVLAAAGEGDFILTLNNDVRFGADYLAALVEAGEANGRAIVTSFCRKQGQRHLVINQAMRVDWRRAKYTTSIEVLNHTLRQVGAAANAAGVSDDVLDEIGVLRGFDYVFGRATLIPVEVFRRVGNFNAEQFPHYFGDSELSSRARRAGFELIVSLKARVESLETEDTTGVHYRSGQLISLRQAWAVLTSRRSAYELRRGFQFVRCCCPRRYRLRNQLRFFRVAMGLSFGRTLVGRRLARPVRAATDLFRRATCRRGRK